MNRLLHPDRVLLLASALLSLAIVSYWITCEWICPMPFYYHPDPQMAYLVDSLSPFKWHLYRYVDHPNATINLISTGIHALTLPLALTSPDPFVLYRLKHPGQFLTLARSLLAILHVGGICILVRHGIRRVHGWDVLGACATAALFFVVHERAVRAVQIWSHDAFFFPLGTMYLLGLFVALRRSDGPLDRRCLVLAGIGGGILLTTHVLYLLYAPGVVCAVVLHARLVGNNVRRCVRDMAVMGAAMFLTCAVLLLPAASELRNSIVWWWTLVSTRGRYGGEGDFAPLDQLQGNLQLLDAIPEVFVGSAAVALIACLGLFVSRTRLRQEPGAVAVATGLLVSLVLGFVVLLAVKSHTNARYFLVIAALLPVLLAVGLTLVKTSPGLSKAIHIGVAVVVLPLFVGNVWRAIEVQRYVAFEFEGIVADRGELLEAYAGAIGRDPDSLRIFWGQGGPWLWSACAAL